MYFNGADAGVQMKILICASVFYIIQPMTGIVYPTAILYILTHEVYTVLSIVKLPGKEVDRRIKKISIKVTLAVPAGTNYINNVL